MSDATIRVLCPNLTCRRVLAVPVSARGRTVRCRGCGTNIRIPATAAPSPPPPAAAPETPVDPVEAPEAGRKKAR